MEAKQDHKHHLEMEALAMVVPAVDQQVDQDQMQLAMIQPQVEILQQDLETALQEMEAAEMELAQLKIAQHPSVVEALTLQLTEAAEVEINLLKFAMSQTHLQVDLPQHQQETVPHMYAHPLSLHQLAHYHL